jgi:hypothetical protein
MLPLAGSPGEQLEENMKTKYTVALSMLAGVALGAVSVGGLYAQGKPPGAYAIVAYSDIPDPAAFKANVVDKAPALIEKLGGHLLVATSDITVLREGTPPFPPSLSKLGDNKRSSTTEAALCVAASLLSPAIQPKVKGA